jgi:hypothetical protein
MFRFLDLIFCAATGGFGDYIQAVGVAACAAGAVAKTQHPQSFNGTMTVRLNPSMHADRAVLLVGDWSNSLCYTHLTHYPGR